MFEICFIMICIINIIKLLNSCIWRSVPISKNICNNISVYQDNHYITMDWDGFVWLIDTVIGQFHSFNLQFHYLQFSSK